MRLTYRLDHGGLSNVAWSLLTIEDLLKDELTKAGREFVFDAEEVVQRIRVISATEGSLILVLDLSAVAEAIVSFSNDSPVGVIADWLTVGAFLWRLAIYGVRKASRFRIRVTSEGETRERVVDNQDVVDPNWAPDVMRAALRESGAAKADSVEIAAVRDDEGEVVVISIQR